MSTSESNVCGEVAEVACHNLYQCCAEGEIEAFLDVDDPRSEAECRDDVRRKCERATASLAFGVEQKHLRFDADRMNDCLDAMVAPSDTCATVASKLPWTEACMTDAWVGLVNDGSACLSSTECASEDSFCGPSQTCVALPIEAQPCGAQGCATGLYCEIGTCRARRGSGGACTLSSQCMTGLFCDLSVAPSVCAPRRAVGEACTSSAGCSSEQCNPGTCANSGAACLTDAACGGRCADDNSPCSTDSTCGFGACSLTAGTCFGPLDCVGTGNVCVFPVRCVLTDCIGDVVCGERHLVVDYCEAALGALPGTR